MDETRPARLLWATAGFILWSLAFIALYAGVSLGCRSPLASAELFGLNALNLALAALLLITILPLAWLVAASSRRAAGTNSFLVRLEFSLAVLGLLATLWIGLPVLFLEPCL